MVIKVWEDGKERLVNGTEGQTILQVLQDAGIYVEAVCGGVGTCGKCTVQVNGVPKLACVTKAAEGMEVVTAAKNEEFTVLGVTAGPVESGSGEYGLAVDIGTTTIAFALMDLKTKKPVFSHGIINSQRALGADVISRIKAADEGKLDALNKCVVEDIIKGITYICKEGKILPESIISMVVAGNTTMLHILLGVSCHSLGQFPFTPVFIDMQRKPFKEVFGKAAGCVGPSGIVLDCDVVLLPGISTYVGADITAGILYGYSLQSDGKDEGTRLLVDLGTNGELALFSKDYVIGTATAAGPAFEAGNISCGTGSIPGAISKAVYRPDSQSFDCETIGGTEPIGVCGSGVLDIAAQLVSHEIIDEVGILEDDFEIAKDITFTQKDVRELQLAKSAVRAGIEILLDESGKSYDDIKDVYLAGGFGHTLNLESAITLGILPKEWRDKIRAIGNSSLAGSILALIDPKEFENIIGFSSKAKEINLSAHPKFNDLFMDYMMFEI